jgi:acetone carboxylase, gamma subunit
MNRRITENLEVDLDRLEWLCHWCGHSLGSARENYKHGCVVAERSPHEIWRPLVDEKHSFSYDPGWARLVEFYCPGCAAMIEVEMLPPGHPITHDIDLDLDALRKRAREEEALAAAQKKEPKP